jgi:hypothetical protein
MVSAMAMTQLWAPPECGDLSLAHCVIEKYNPELVVLMINDGNGRDPAVFADGNRRLIQHIREFPENRVRFFIVVGPPSMHVDNPYGPGVAVVDMKRVAETALQHGLRLMASDNFHLRPVVEPFDDEGMAIYAQELFRYTLTQAASAGSGVTGLNEAFFEMNPWPPES